MINDKKHIGSNPVGVKGLLVGHIMNIMHQREYSKLLKQIITKIPRNETNLAILDIGCGGGKAIEIFCKQIADAKIIGIDHSLEMVKLSSRINQNNIKKGKA